MEEGPWEEIFGGSAEEEAFPVGTERRDGGLYDVKLEQISRKKTQLLQATGSR